MAKKSMIFKALAMLLLLVFALGLMASCKAKKGDGTDAPIGTEGLIYNSKTELKLILVDYDYYETPLTELLYALKDNLGDRLTAAYVDDSLEFDHEIIIGRSERQVSKKAYTYLEDLMSGKGSEFGGYVLYSDGSSLALAYTEEIGDQHIADILASLTEQCKNKSFVAERGIISGNTFNMYEIYGEEDKRVQDDAFELLAQQTSKEVADAVRQMYQSLYRRSDAADVVSWLANLYEPRKCICENYDENGIRVCLHPVDDEGNDLCKNGGFYYSNGARNTDGYLPDIESTYQALEFLEKTGMLTNYGDKFQNFISGQIKADIVAFTRGLQNEDGYFYHPQWGKEATRQHWERVSRDLMWSVAILEAFKESPYYSTPAGELVGSGGRPAAPDSALTGKLNTSTVAAVSKISAVASNLPDHLQSISAFRAYLAGFKMNVYGGGYTAANALAAQVSQLVAANQRLGGNQLRDTLFEWVAEHHRADNGFWRAEVDYDGANTVFKIIMVYSAFRTEFPNAMAAAKSVIQVLSSDEVPGHVCGAYNAWYDIAGLVSNIRAYGNSGDADNILQEVYSIAPEAILNTIANTAQFLCVDGSFSYFPDKTSELSQNMPASPAGKMGDINAALICTGGIIEHISQALGVKLPPIYGTRELAQFMDIVSENGFSLKDQLPPDKPASFEDEDLGNKPLAVGVSQASGGSTVVAEDPVDSNNRVVNFKSLAKSGTWDSINIPNNTAKGTNNCLVFEGDFYFASEGTSEGYLIQLYIGGQMGKPTAYFFNFTVVGNTVQVWECSADDNSKSFSRLMGTFPLDKWFKLRVEYYMGVDDETSGTTAHDTVKIKVYTTDPNATGADADKLNLVAVSSNYMDASMNKFIDGVGTPADGEGYGATFFVMSYLACNIYMDDLYLGYNKIEYKNEKDTEGLIINEDSDAERKLYDFEDAEKPAEDITASGSGITFANGSMALGSGSGSLSIPALTRKHLANVFSLGFDITIDSATEGDAMVISFKDPYKDSTIVSYTMRCTKIDGVLYFVPVYKGSTVLSSVAIPVDGTKHSLELALFVDEATTLIYKDGKMLASTEQAVIGNCFFYEMSRAEITYNGNMSAKVDNIFCERRVGDFAEETKPQVDRVLYDFGTSALPEGVTSNGVVTGGMLNLTGGKYITIPANDRSAYISAYQLHTYVDITGSTDDEAFYIRFVDAQGITVAGIVIEVRGGAMYIYEMLRDQRVGEYVATGKFDGTANILVNIYPKEGAMEIYIDNVLVLVTATFNGTECGGVAGAKLTSDTAYIDDVYLDGIMLTYTNPKVVQSTKDSIDEVITYEHSSLGSIPTRINIAPGSTQTYSVGFVTREEAVNKVLIYNKMIAEYPSGIRYTFRDGVAKSQALFETDIKFVPDVVDMEGTNLTGKSNFDVLFANQSGGTQMFTAQFWVLKNKTTGKNHLWVNMNNGRTSAERIDCGEIAEDGWMNLKFEVKGGDGTAHEKSGAKLVIYVNGEEKLVSQHYMDIQAAGGSMGNDGVADTTTVYQAMIIPSTMFTGTIYIDNTRLEALTK